MIGAVYLVPFDHYCLRRLFSKRDSLYCLVVFWPSRKLKGSY